MRIFWPNTGARGKELENELEATIHRDYVCRTNRVYLGRVFFFFFFFFIATTLTRCVIRDQPFQPFQTRLQRG